MFFRLGVALDMLVVEDESPLWFAARMASKEGCPQKGLECWSLVHHIRTRTNQQHDCNTAVTPMKKTQPRTPKFQKLKSPKNERIQPQTQVSSSAYALEQIRATPMQTEDGELLTPKCVFEHPTYFCILTCE